MLIVDDVISTGESLHAMEELVKRAGGIIAGKMAVLQQKYLDAVADYFKANGDAFVKKSETISKAFEAQCPDVAPSKELVQLEQFSESVKAELARAKSPMGTLAPAVSSAGQPITWISPPYSSTSSRMAMPEPRPTIAIRLCPQAWPSPARASYSVSMAILTPGFAPR